MAFHHCVKKEVWKLFHLNIQFVQLYKHMIECLLKLIQVFMSTFVMLTHLSTLCIMLFAWQNSHATCIPQHCRHFMKVLLKKKPKNPCSKHFSYEEFYTFLYMPCWTCNQTSDDFQFFSEKHCTPGRRNSAAEGGTGEDDAGRTRSTRGKTDKSCN